jgi:uncharacterized protein YhdP
VTQEKEGWQFAIPDTRITMDGKPWPRGALSAGLDAGAGRWRHGQ